MEVLIFLSFLPDLVPKNTWTTLDPGSPVLTSQILFDNKLRTTTAK